MDESSRPSVAHLPVGAFAMIMGVGGLAAAWNRAAEAWEVPAAIGAVLGWAALALLAVLLVAYGVKIARHRREVGAEWRHPVRTAFTATIPIAILITSVALVPHHEPVSAVLWWAGAATMLAVSVWVMHTWSTDARVEHVNVHPAWFIPVVGTLVVPLTGVDHAPVDVSWFFFGVGLLYWLGLLPIVLTRLFVHGVIPPRLVPTLAIMVAPPAVAAIAWTRLGGEWSDPLSRILLSVTLFNLIVLAAHARALRAAPFALSTWAYTFPLAAAAVAFLAAFEAGSGEFYAWAGGLALAVASAVVLGLAWHTARGFTTGALLQPEP